MVTVLENPTNLLQPNVVGNPMLLVVAIVKLVVVRDLVSSPLTSYPHIHRNLLFLSSPRLKLEHKQEHNLSRHTN
jgi:hypothetical protein